MSVGSIQKCQRQILPKEFCKRIVFSCVFYLAFWRKTASSNSNILLIQSVVLANGCSEYQATSTCKPNLSRYFIMKFLTLVINLEYSTCIFHRRYCYHKWFIAPVLTLIKQQWIEWKLKSNCLPSVQMS